MFRCNHVAVLVEHIIVRSAMCLLPDANFIFCRPSVLTFKQIIANRLSQSACICGVLIVIIPRLLPSFLFQDTIIGVEQILL